MENNKVVALDAVTAERGVDAILNSVYERLTRYPDLKFLQFLFGGFWHVTKRNEVRNKMKILSISKCIEYASKSKECFKNYLSGINDSKVPSL